MEKILESIPETNNQIINPQLKDPTQLVENLWQDLWSISGDDTENCLYTVVELFIFKNLSDLNVLSGFYSFDELLKKYETNTAEDVLQFYNNVIRTEIKNKFKESDHDKTSIFDESISDHATAFKKALTKFKEYEKTFGKFDHIHDEFAGNLLAELK